MRVVALSLALPQGVKGLRRLSSGIRQTGVQIPAHSTSPCLVFHMRSDCNIIRRAGWGSGLHSVLMKGRQPGAGCMVSAQGEGLVGLPPGPGTPCLPAV